MNNTVYFSPITQLYENAAPGTLINGSPGSGKSYFISQIMMNNKTQGIINIGLDPKNDMLKITNIDTEYKKVDLSASLELHENNRDVKYSLDPFRCVNSVDANFIMDIIETLVGGLTQKQTIAITPIVNDFIKRSTTGQASMLGLLKHMYQHQNIDVQEIGTILNVCKDSKFGKIMFNDEKTGVNFTKENSIICLFGLPIPKTDNINEWSKEERYGSAIIMVIIKMLQELLTNNNKVPVCLFIDEAHIVLTNPSIYKLVEQFLILGRSLNCVTILASQNVTHFPKDFNNFCTNKFQFRSSKNEIVEFMKRFNEDSTVNEDGFVNFCVNADNGQCIFIDRKNRISTIQIRGDLNITTNAIVNADKTK